MAPPNKKETENEESSSGYGVGALLGAAALGGALAYGLNYLLSSCEESSSRGHSSRESTYGSPNQSFQSIASNERRAAPSSFSFENDLSGGEAEDPNLKAACVVCWTKRPELIMLPCNHINVCKGCWETLQETMRATRGNQNQCITCRQNVSSTQRAYLS